LVLALCAAGAINENSAMKVDLVIRPQPRAGEQRELFVGERPSGVALSSTKIDLAVAYERLSTLRPMAG